MGEIRWTEKAISNLENIFEFIAKDSPLFAEKFISNLVKSTKILENMPKSGRKVPELENYEFRELIRKGYRLVYRIKENSTDIEILAVIHSSRNMNTDILS